MKRLTLINIIILIAFICKTANAQWERFGGTNYPWYISCAAFNGTNLFVGEPTTVGGLLRSSDASKTWTRVGSGLAGFHDIRSMLAAGNNLYAGTDSNGVYLSTDGGTSWTLASNGLPPNCEVRSLAKSGINLVAGCVYQRGVSLGVFLSSDSGRSWMPGGVLGEYVVCLFSYGTTLFAGTLQGVYRSLDDGQSWTMANSGISGAAWSFAAIGENLFAGTYSGVFLSTDKGVTWKSVAASQTLSPIVTVGTVIFAALPPGMVSMSSDTGRTWTDISQGMQEGIEITNLFTGAGFLFAGCDIGGLWRRPLTQMVTSVPPGTSDNQPAAFKLEQNYPNPFNPSTMIKYSVGGSGDRGSGTSKVKLTLYDLLGREVTVLVNEEKQPGNYSVHVDGSGLASGIYFYRLEAGTYAETRTLTLLK